MTNRRRSAGAAKKPGSVVHSSTSPTHIALDSKAATQHADQSLNRHLIEASPHLTNSDMHQKTHDRRSRSPRSPAHQVGSFEPAVEAGARVATHAAALDEFAFQAQSHQAQQGRPGSNGWSASSSAQATDATQSVLHGRCSTRSVTPVSLVPNAVAELTQQPSLADSGTTSVVMSGDVVTSTATKRGRGKKKETRPCKAGPPAFPELPYERSLRLHDSESHAQPLAPHLAESRHALPASASDTARHTSAQTDTLADAMQQRLQLQERWAEGPLGEGQGGPQQRLSQHGGYMQREGQERLPRRRTTRSMLRGADTQTGKKLPPCSLLHRRLALTSECKPMMGAMHSIVRHSLQMLIRSVETWMTSAWHVATTKVRHQVVATEHASGSCYWTCIT